METIKEINLKLQNIYDLNDPKLVEYGKDDRIGVIKIVNQRIKLIEKLNKNKKEHRKRQEFEEKLLAEGYQLIAGIDEVGRGPLAGPVVTAAVILPVSKEPFVGINDSKQLSAVKRAEYVEIIKQNALAYSISVFDNQQIDQHNIYRATQLAMIDAVNKLEIQPEYLLIDAMKLDIDLPQQSIIKGDQRSISIAAASILAKEYRDQMMKEYAKIFPHYGFEKNMGYGTKEHLEGLKRYGYTEIHRKSFEPIKSMIN